MIRDYITCGRCGGHIYVDAQTGQQGVCDTCGWVAREGRCEGKLNYGVQPSGSRKRCHKAARYVLSFAGVTVRVCAEHLASMQSYLVDVNEPHQVVGVAG